MPLKSFALFAGLAAAAGHSQWQNEAIADLVLLSQHAKNDPEGVYHEVIKGSELNQILQVPADEVEAVGDGTVLPFVFGHGMGDSCFNDGMIEITKAVGKHTGTLLKANYAVCVPTGDDQASDTNNGFFMNMNENVDVFAKKIMADPKLKGGFNAVGFSQGNSLIRGYIHKYNNPPVKNFISVHGTVSGVAGFPQCNPSRVNRSAILCDVFDRILSVGAYHEIIQNHLFQAGYYREPASVGTAAYKKYSQIAQWNNEGDAGVNATYKDNFVSVGQYVMVKALGDTMVEPREGEWWGEFAHGSYKDLITMKNTDWYTKDMFGLKTVDTRGDIHFETTTGNHLQFTKEQLFGWVDKYIMKKAEATLVV